VNCLEYDPNFKKGKTKDGHGVDYDDGLDRQVSALPHSITCRFGEVVFAQGGTGYGWWPCQIYDPRQAMDATVRQTAQKYLHSRYLVYFFNCGNMEVIGTSSRAATNAGSNPHAVGTSNNDTVAHHVNPFAVLPTKMIKSWLIGMSEELYLGRAAKAHGKQRYREFRDAFQMASLEHDKPKRSEQRRSISRPESHASPILGTDKFKKKELFLSPSPINKHLSPTKLLQLSPRAAVKKGNRHKESVKNPAIQWYHITIQNKGQHDQKATASSVSPDGNLHPAFACFATLNENNEEISDVLDGDRDSSSMEREDKREVVFSCPWPPLLTRLHGSYSKKSRSQSLPNVVSDAKERAAKPTSPSDSMVPVNPRVKRQRTSKSLGDEDINVKSTSGSPDENIVETPTELKRKRGRPRKTESS
jgi:PWWP domain